MRYSFWILCFLFQFLFCFGAFAANENPQIETATRKNWSFETFGLTPVQSGGRMKPLDSLAQEVVLFETGSRTFQGWQPLDLMLSWIASPQYWESQTLIRVGREDVRRQLGLDEKRTFYSPQELMRNPILAQYAERMGHGGSETTVSPPGAPRSSPRDQELKAVLDRIGLFQGLVTGQGWLIVPKPAPAAWASLIDLDPEGNFIRSQFVQLVKTVSSRE